MNGNLTSALRKHFGFSEFRPGQAEAIDSILAGRHTLVVMPTGAGKSLIFQLAGLQRDGVSLVISPLISLMRDQVEGLARRNIPATYINSTLSAAEQKSRLEGMISGKFRLVYIAPERLRSAPFLAALKQIKVGLLAVDEAHCISHWGHDFRPDYLHIGQARSHMKEPLTVALTATATPRVQDDIAHLLNLGTAERIITGFNRPNLTFQVHYAYDASAKLRALQNLLSDPDHSTAIVYTGTRRDAEEVAEFIREVIGIKVEFYHAGLEPDARERVQEAFMRGDLPVITTTNAFGMGVDRADVRAVVHYSLPGTIEAYYQEAGRAGRDGKPAFAALIYSPEDRALQEWFIENDAILQQDLSLIYRALQKIVRKEGWATHEDISIVSGVQEVKIRLALAQLETAGVIHRLGDEGARMLVQVGDWDDAAVKISAFEAEKRRTYRKKQLEQMVAYAETDTCRRRIILDHFGDLGPAESPNCCDNCMAIHSKPVDASQAEGSKLTQAEKIALIILDAIRLLKIEVGKCKLAGILKGSKAKSIKRFGYDKHQHYGKLAILSAEEIEELMDQLMAGGYIKSIGGNLPVLHLTPRGTETLRNRVKTSVKMKRVIHRAQADREKAKRNAGGTVELTAQLFADGMHPEQIAKERGMSVQAIYEHLAKLIEYGRVQLSTVVPEEVAAQIRRSIERVGDYCYLSPIKSHLPESISYEQIRCVVADMCRSKDGKAPSKPPVDQADDVYEFLERAHPRQLTGPWKAGWALDFNSRFAGANWSRSRIGDLAFRLKYREDQSAFQPLMNQAMDFFSKHREMADVDVVVPMPPTVQRSFNPVGALADALGGALGLPVREIRMKVRVSAPQKEMHTLAQKHANVTGAFALQSKVKGMRILLLDDLYDSGATLEEAARTLAKAGASCIHVLTLTRTIHSDA